MSEESTKKKSKSLTILVYTTNGVGHVNACLGLTEQLKARGHRIVFVVGSAWYGKIEHYGFVNIFIGQNRPNYDRTKKSPSATADKLGQLFKEYGIYEHGNSYDKFNKLCNLFRKHFQIKERYRELETELRMAIDKHRPDLFIIDNFFLPAVIGYSTKPWVRMVSTAPFFYDQIDNIPPSCSGFPTNGDPNEWTEFRKIRDNFFHCDNLAEVIKEMGYDPYPGNITFPSTYALSIYGYPAELDYKELCHYPDNWINVESFMRDSKFEQFEMPQSLIDARNKYPGKLIYLALGSMCSADVKLMKRFVEILSKTKHRYIVSKGPKHSEFELTENMWGDRYIPQTKILPVIDLVISHGGNNTVSETLANGKPLIVFPFFGDQFDNAQRIAEVGLGQRLNPYNFDDHQLTDAIDQLLYDTKLQRRLTKISQRILGTDRFKEALDRIEALFS